MAKQTITTLYKTELTIPNMLDRIMANQIALMEAASLARNWDDMRLRLSEAIEITQRIIRRE